MLFTIYFAAEVAPQEYMVVRKARDNVTLDCPQLEKSEEFDSIIWNKNATPIIKIGKNQHIEYTPSSLAQKVTVTSSHQIILTSLELPDSGVYICQIFLVNLKDGSSELRKTTHNLLVNDVPSAPGKPTMKNLQSRQTDITWLPGSSNNSPILYYNVSIGECVKNNTRTEVTLNNSTEITVHGLKPYTCYVSSVSAINALGQSVSSEASDQFVTLEEVPLKPRITHISNNKPTSFYVNWVPPREINGKLIKYELQWITKGDIKSRYIAGHLIDTMTAFISDLTPYTHYKVQVAAVTNAGTGEFSDQFPALTDVAAPGPPRNFNVTELNASSIHLSWDPPLIFYKNIDEYLIKGFDHRGQEIQEKVNGQITQYTLKNLASNSRYYLKVAAITNAIFSASKYFGDFTDPVAIILGAPTQAPQDFKLVKVSDSEIELEWKAPHSDTLNGELEGFEVEYGTAAQDMKSLSIEDPQKTRTLLQGLKPFTLYRVSVKAKNMAGVGPEVMMEVRTEGGPYDVKTSTVIWDISNHGNPALPLHLTHGVVAVVYMLFLLGNTL